MTVALQRISVLVSHLNAFNNNNNNISSQSQLYSSSTATSSSTSPTADLCDSHTDKLQLISTPFRTFGLNSRCCGQALTIKCHEDNSLVRSTLEQQGHQRVLIVDGGGSKRCALVGDQLAELAVNNQWNGIIVNGCIRDSAVINTKPIHIKALSTNPFKSHKRNSGQLNVVVSLDGSGSVKIESGDWIYSDEDGVLVSKHKLQ